MKNEATKNTKTRRVASKDDSPDVAFQAVVVEVDQKADSQSSGFQVGQHLCLVDGIEPVGALILIKTLSSTMRSTRCILSGLSR